MKGAYTDIRIQTERRNGIVRRNFNKHLSGEYSEEATPVPIPNTAVKLLSADGTWWETAWENRSLPVLKREKGDVMSPFS